MEKPKNYDTWCLIPIKNLIYDKKDWSKISLKFKLKIYGEIYHAN